MTMTTQPIEKGGSPTCTICEPLGSVSRPPSGNRGGQELPILFRTAGESDLVKPNFREGACQALCAQSAVSNCGRVMEEQKVPIDATRASFAFDSAGGLCVCFAENAQSHGEANRSTHHWRESLDRRGNGRGGCVGPQRTPSGSLRT
jgi:hypothetical protein